MNNSLINNDITGSIVCYKNDRIILSAAINSFLNTKLNVKLYLVDNSPEDTLRDISSDPRVEYIFNPTNPGFGAAHNIAIEKSLKNSTYYLILNPDIYFNKGVLESLINYMGKDANIGIVMPKVLNPDDSIQRVSRLLPTPIDFIVRRFIPNKAIKKMIDVRYELHNYQYNKPLQVPFLSGCFMLFSTTILGKINGFDNNIFMYTEDIDICRRVIGLGYKTMVYPEVAVFHAHERKSFLRLRNLTVYTRSAFYYFNKWGWFFDKERSKINKDTLNQL